MFQRIKGAIDRTIAEEQARQKTYLEQGTPGHGRQSSAVSRSNSGASSAGKRTRPKKAVQDASKEADAAAANPDPAVFEAAFVIDDDDEPSRTSTPPPQYQDIKSDAQDKDGGALSEMHEVKAGDDGADAEKTGAGDGLKPEGTQSATSSKAASVELPADVRAKLRKLEKLEATYPG